MGKPTSQELQQALEKAKKEEAHTSGHDDKSLFL